MHLLFDLDGTLTDSKPGILNCIQHAMSSHSLAVPRHEELGWCIGPPLRETLTRLLGDDAHGLLDPVLATYRERYSSIGLFENEIYPEIVETLSVLRDQGHTMYVATSKVEVYAQRIIDHFGLAEFFVSVNGSGMDGSRANKAILIAHVMQSHDIAPTETVMIGDREHDMIGAKANDIPAIGALWGYGSGRELMESGATLCARVPHLLPELIASLE
jgi:phosphoglycolate phosphatase